MPHPNAIFAQSRPTVITTGEPLIAGSSGMCLFTDGIAIAGPGVAAFLPQSPNEMLILATVMARAARALGADPDAADQALSEMAAASRQMETGNA